MSGAELPQVVRLETRRVVVVSTLHILPATSATLRETALEDWPVSGGPIAFGFYLYAHEEPPAACPADLAPVLAFARAAGFDYVQLDADGPTLEGLPTYDSEWDAPSQSADLTA